MLPPVSILNKTSAAYHFLRGYTANVGATEVGSTKSMDFTFSTCFGAPFFPRPASVYADLVIKRIEKMDTKVYLVNTGWTGGGYGVGKRFPIPVTRAIISAIQDNAIDHNDTYHMESLNLTIPNKISGVDEKYLNPREAWEDKDMYDSEAEKLAQRFKDNIKKFEVSEESLASGPK